MKKTTGGKLFLIFSFLVFIVFASVPGFALECANNQQVRMGPVPIGSSDQGVRFNYFNTGKRMANVSVKFYMDDNTLLDTQTETVEPGKGIVFPYELNGVVSDIFVKANVSFDDPIIAFDDPIIAFDGFQVPVFLTSLETYDGSGQTGIWGTEGTAIWGTNGTSIVSANQKPNNQGVSRSRTTLAFPPITIAQGETVQLAMTNGSEQKGGSFYLKFVDSESGATVDEYEDLYCKLEFTCNGPVTKDPACWEQVCRPQSVQPGEKMYIQFTNYEITPKNLIPVMESFDDPIIAFDDPIIAFDGFQVPVFMPTMTVKSSDGGVKFYQGAANQLSPPSCR